MTRERAKELVPIIAAWGEGKRIQYMKGNEYWTDIVLDDWSFEEKDIRGMTFRIKPEPRTRPMTRGEVLYMVTTTPAMVVKRYGDDERPSQFFDYDYVDSTTEDYEYAIIDKTGEPIDGWHKFEVVE